MGRRGQQRGDRHEERRGAAPVSQLEDLMRRRGVDAAWDALEDEMMRAGLPSDRFTVSRMLMRTLADGRRNWDLATWQELKSFCEVLVKINRSIALVERFVEQQPSEADEVLFNAMLDTHSRTKDIARLESTYQRMKDLGVEASHVTLGILVKAYGQVCDIQKVLQLWDEMKEQREQANAVTYGCMINACVKCSQTEKALQIFRDMQKRHKQCNTILYTTLIKGYGNEKDLSTAIVLFREMRNEGVPYNTIAYNSIIDVCIKCSEVGKAEEFFQEMMSDHSPVQPDLITYSTLLKGYCQVGDLDKALHVAATIKACGMQCDELVYNTLMDGCVKANDLSAGVGLFAEMANAGMKPSSITHSIFLRLYQRNGYKGNALDAVAQLYQHHGLEKPSGTVEKASRAAARRENRAKGAAKPRSTLSSGTPAAARGGGSAPRRGSERGPNQQRGAPATPQQPGPMAIGVVGPGSSTSHPSGTSAACAASMMGGCAPGPSPGMGYGVMNGQMAVPQPVAWQPVAGPCWGPGRMAPQGPMMQGPQGAGPMTPSGAAPGGAAPPSASYIDASQRMPQTGYMMPMVGAQGPGIPSRPATFAGMALDDLYARQNGGGAARGAGGAGADGLTGGFAGEAANPQLHGDPISPNQFREWGRQEDFLNHLMR